MPITAVYRTVEGCDLKADAHGAEPGARKPAVLWLHGGGLIFGTRTRPRPTFTSTLIEAGAVVVSIDYRLAPETQLPEILEDICAAWNWLHANGSELFGIDPDRLAVAGGSAGGYLALTLGYRAAPPPRAIASICGFGDITRPWEADPSPHYLKRDPVSRELALKHVGHMAIAEDPAEDVADRGYFYLYCRQQGRWLIEVTGHDPKEDPGWFDLYCPLRNISPEFPPTILIHGTNDNDVPCDESRDLATRMAQSGVDHELLAIEGAAHGLGGVAPEVGADAERRAARFLLERV